jgi:acetylornithine deacetylase/succinyl-diaminopimelate desuccinylase-like protein
MKFDLIDRVIDLTIEIQQIAAPPFSEEPRAEFVRDQFSQDGLNDVSMDELSNVYARIPGSGRTSPLVVTAHLDTVFPLDTDLSVRRENARIYGPGIGDNSLGVAALFGLSWLLSGQELPGDLWLVANVGEEGLGDLRGMKAVVDRFKDRVLAYLILEGMALGQVYHRALGVERYRINVQTPGGHSWVNFGKPSAIHEMAELVTELVGIRLPKQPRTTLNVGVISGGTSVNTIAEAADIQLDLRSEDKRMLDYLVKQVEDRLTKAQKADVQVTKDVIGRRPAGEIPTDHALVQLVKDCLADRGLRAALAIGSTDANIPLSRGIPAVCVGLTSGSGAHTQNEYINLEPIEKGLEFLISVVLGAFEELGSGSE